MTVAIQNLTTSDAVRSALGVAEAELLDDVFESFNISDELELELSLWLPEVYNIGELIKEPQSAVNRKRQLLLESYSKFYCAYLLAISAPSWMNKKITDGQNELQRFDSIGGLSDSMASQASRYKTLLIDTFTTATTAVEPLSLFSSVPPSYDPVTGETS